MKLAYLTLILVATVFGQVGQFSAVNLSAGPPPIVAPNFLSAKVVGTPGTTTYYYWVAANYASGQSSLSGPVVVTTANATLSGSNYVQINFNGNGASSYVVLRTTTSVAPVNGTATNAVVTASTTTTVNDQSNSLNSFTLNISTGANSSLTLDATNYPTPTLTTNSTPLNVQFPYCGGLYTSFCSNSGGTSLTTVETMVIGNTSINPSTATNTFVIFGDSITANNGFPDNSKARNANGYWDWAQLKSGNRTVLLANAGVSGDTTAMMLARIQTSVIQYHPKFVVVEGGINDIRQGMASTTIIANLNSIKTLLLADGSKVILTTILPYTVANGASQAQGIVWAAVNNWIRQQAQTNPNVYIVDFASAYIDATNAALYPLPANQVNGTDTSDGLHPASLGSSLMGAQLATLITNLLPPITGNLTWNNNPQNLVSNGLLTGSGGTLAGVVTGTAPTGWTVETTGSACSSTQSSRADGFGSDIALNVTAANQSQYCRLNQSLTTFPSGGDIVYLEAEVTPVGNVDEFWLIATFLGSAFEAKGTTEWNGKTFTNGSDTGTLTIRTNNFQCPSGIAHGTVIVGPYGTSQLKIGRVSLVKVN